MKFFGIIMVCCTLFSSLATEQDALAVDAIKALMEKYRVAHRMNVILEIEMTEGDVTTNVRLDGMSQRKDAKHARIELEAKIFSKWPTQHGSSSVTKHLGLTMVKDGTYLWCDFNTDGLQKPEVMRLELHSLQNTYAKHKKEIPVIFQSPVADPSVLLATMLETMDLNAQSYADGFIEIKGQLSPEVIAVLDLEQLKEPSLVLAIEPAFPVAYRVLEGERAMLLLHHSNYEKVEPHSFAQGLFVFELSPERTVKDLGK